jgi:uncharacterized protein with PIN domain
MPERAIETRLVQRQSHSPKVCTHCNTKITPGEVYHQEEGVSEHIHSLIARRFCTQCYAKYGEHFLLKGSNK